MLLHDPRKGVWSISTNILFQLCVYVVAGISTGFLLGFCVLWLPLEVPSFPDRHFSTSCFFANLSSLWYSVSEAM